MVFEGDVEVFQAQKNWGWDASGVGYRHRVNV
jgi:hypothetical protein